MSQINPKDGDVIISCGHIDTATSWHWFQFDTPIGYTRFDGSPGVAQWQVCCDACFVSVGGDPDNIPAVEDHVWQGDGPVFSLENN